jgi:hypothetical protein
MIRYDEHAEFQMERRGIAKVWVEQTIREPEVTQSSGNRRSYFRCVAGRRIMLRVVTPLHDPDYVITAYFDRTKPCA